MDKEEWYIGLRCRPIKKEIGFKGSDRLSNREEKGCRV